MVIAANNKDEQHNHQSSMADGNDGLDNLNFMSKKLPETSQRRKRSNNTLSGFPNFSSPPSFDVKWGGQKQLRCIKQLHQDNHDLPSSSSFSRSTGNNENVGTIEAVTDKLMLDFCAEVQQIKEGFFQKPEKTDILNKPGAVETGPWNLRTRRAVCKEPNGVNGGEPRPGLFLAKLKEINVVNGGGSEVQKRRAKFSVSLSKKEIEEDFLAMLGTRPPKKPKKRPRYVQREIDELLPGNWLTEIKADMYKVNEQSETGKR